MPRSWSHPASPDTPVRSHRGAMALGYLALGDMQVQPQPQGLVATSRSKRPPCSLSLPLLLRADAGPPSS